MTVSHELVNAVAQVSAERMLDSLLIGMALAAFAWTLLRLLPRQNSATRFALWFAALIATAVLPFVNSASGTSTLMQRVAPTARPLISVPASWALYLFVFWAVIAAVSIARFVFGFAELRRLRRQCCAIELADPGWREIAARVCPARQVEILSSDRIHVPTAVGFFRPAVVVIPTSLLGELTPAELTQVLLHELAHLRRWDDWTNLVQKFVEAVLFFHPAVWWMEGRISLEREMACDDAVLAETSCPRAYAECLATLAEKSFLRRSAVLAQAAVNRIRQTSLRVAQILDADRCQHAPARKSALALLGAFACACGAVAWHAPQLVAFETSPPVIASNPMRAINAQPTAFAAAAVASRAEAQPRLAAIRRTSQPRAVMAKATAVAETPSPARARGSDSGLRVIAQARRVPQMIQAKASTTYQPAFQTGVIVIFVDDPVFGPIPVFWHFAVWQVTPPPHAEQGAPQKNI